MLTGHSEILFEDPAVKECLDKFGGKDEDKKSRAYFNLREAASVAKLWNGLTAQSRKLPSKYEKLLKVD